MALGSFKNASLLDPQAAEPYAGKSIALTAMDQPAAAKEALDKALALNPNSYEAQLANAFYLREQGKPLLALQELRDVILNKGINVTFRCSKPKKHLDADRADSTNFLIFTPALRAAQVSA